MSEDCLVLNVWTPAISDGRKRPVMFWCHGGAFIAGSLAAIWGLKLAMVLPALAMAVLIGFVLVWSRIWTMRTVERPASA